ncbi:serine/threonine-protein kinase PINK1, partial [Tropilaelaps mercedesae]
MMRPFSWISFGARWLFEVLAPGAQTTSICIRSPTKVDQAYFLRDYFGVIFTRWGSGAGAFTNNGRSYIANVGKVRGGSAGSKAPGGGSGSALHKIASSNAETNTLSDSFITHITRRYAYRDTPAATLSRQSIQRVLALRQCVPLLGFVGVCLVDKPTVITPDEELEGVCVEIRRIFDKINFDIYNREALPVAADKAVNLSNFELGDPIAKGCNAAVYSAKLRQPQELVKKSSNKADQQRIATIKEEALDADESGSPPLSTSPPRKYAAELEVPAGSFDAPTQAVTSGPLGPYDLALKMMFNYDAESNAAAIWQSLSRECAPLQTSISAAGEPDLNLPVGSFVANREANLPPHPCIVDVK